jgi:ABC-2 type transport system permease protein
VAKGLGWLVRVPDSASGAVTGRIAQYWQRDGRYAMGLIMPVILTVVFMIRAGQDPAILWGAPLTMGMIYPMIESNNLAYDGQGFAMHALAGVSGRDDRVGRARVSVVVSMFFVIVTSLIAMVATGAFAGGLPLHVASAAVGGAIGFVLAGIGLAEVLSTVLIYPVASADKPFSSPQGRAAAQGFFPFIQMLGSFLLMAPTIGVLIGILVGTGKSSLMWVVGLVGILNGAAFLVGGVALGGRILDRRIPKVIATLNNFASLQK